MGTGNKSVYAMHDQIIQVFKKYDEVLNQTDFQKNKLLLQISLESLTFCIFNQDLNKFLSIESISFKPQSRLSEIVDQLKHFYLDHPWLKQSFHSVKLFFESNKSTLVPTPLFDEKEKSGFSYFNFQMQNDELIVFNKLVNLDAYIIYSLPEIILKTLKGIFSEPILYCHSGAFIESLLILNKNQKLRKRIFVYVRKNFLDIVILDGRKLLYFNTFQYRTKEDFIYFVIFVLEQLQLNPEEIELELSGSIDRNSKLFDTIYKYIRDVNFQTKTDIFNYSYIFNDNQVTTYLNLLNFELCEL